MGIGLFPPFIALEARYRRECVERALGRRDRRTDELGRKYGYWPALVLPRRTSRSQLGEWVGEPLHLRAPETPPWRDRLALEKGMHVILYSLFASYSPVGWIAVPGELRRGEGEGKSAVPHQGEDLMLRCGSQIVPSFPGVRGTWTLALRHPTIPHLDSRSWLPRGILASPACMLLHWGCRAVDPLHRRSRCV